MVRVTGLEILGYKWVQDVRQRDQAVLLWVTAFSFHEVLELVASPMGTENYMFYVGRVPVDLERTEHRKDQ